jgi:PA domain-containing protein
MTRRGFGLLIRVLLLLTGISIALGAQGSAPTPGVVAGNFTTHGPGFFKNREEAALLIDHYFALGATLQPSLNAEFFHIGVPPFTYTWTRTNATETVGKGKKAVQVNSGVAAIVQALATPGPPGALFSTATNPTDMGTAGILGLQALTLKINQGFSEVFVTPVTGFSGLSLVNMTGVELEGSVLTPAQVDALNGQATLQIREATDVPLGGGPLPYGLSFGQLTDLIDLLNGSFEDGQPSGFAQAHLYQPYVTSPAFAGKRPSTVSVFASKPTYNTFEGEVISVGTGCNSSDYASFPAGRIALIERGVCTFYQKVSTAKAAFAIGAIIFNSLPEIGGACPAVPTPGSSRCEALVGMGATAPFAPISIPAAFVQRSTGLALRSHAPVHAFVQQ